MGTKWRFGGPLARRPAGRLGDSPAIGSVGAGAADPTSEDTLLPIDQPGGDYNGGMLASGPDGYLYASIGDGGCCGDPNGQDRTELRGSVLRLDLSVEERSEKCKATRVRDARRDPSRTAPSQT